MPHFSPFVSFHICFLWGRSISVIMKGPTWNCAIRGHFIQRQAPLLTEREATHRQTCSLQASRDFKRADTRIHTNTSPNCRYGFWLQSPAGLECSLLFQGPFNNNSGSQTVSTTMPPRWSVQKFGCFSLLRRPAGLVSLLGKQVACATHQLMMLSNNYSNGSHVTMASPEHQWSRTLGSVVGVWNPPASI